MIQNYKISGPTRVVLEASMEAIMEQDLDMFDGEQYDSIDNVISITNDGNVHTFETCRSWEAWHKGVPNAGRMTLTIENKWLEKVHIPNNN